MYAFELVQISAFAQSISIESKAKFIQYDISSTVHFFIEKIYFSDFVIQEQYLMTCFTKL